MMTVEITDPHGALIALARVSESDGLYRGTVEFRSIPGYVLDLFHEFEQTINDQGFSDVDRLSDAIASLGLLARFDDGFGFPIFDLQVFPEAGDLSFRVTRAAPIVAAR